MKKWYKFCPYCAEEIRDNAVKCCYCWEFLWESVENENLKKHKNWDNKQGLADWEIAVIIIASIAYLLFFARIFTHGELKDWYNTIQYEWGKYEWYIVNEQRNWQWINYWVDWDIYEWNWKNDKKEWYWIYYFADWRRYEWEWKNGKKEWKGTFYWADWTKYEWNWKNDKGEWYWKYYWTDWYRYEWYYKNGRKDWDGIEYRSDWRRFEWNFKVWYEYNWKVLNNYGKQVWYVKNWIFYNNDWSYIQTFYKFDQDPEWLLK